MMIIPYLIFRLKGIDETKKSLICYIALIECLTCLQGTQANTIIAAIFLTAFLSFENRNYWLAAVVIVIGFYIKIFPLAALSLCIFYPGKINFLLKFLVAFVLIGFIPAMLIGPTELFWQYKNWLRMVVEYQHNNYGVSVIGFIGANFGISDMGKVLVQAAGLFLLGIGYTRPHLFSNYMYRLFFLSALMIWVALFNHGAEDFSYSISIIGIGIWYVCQPKNNLLNWFLVLFILIACVSPIDPTPKPIIHFVIAHKLKAIPYAVMWLVITYQLVFKKNTFFNDKRLMTG
jgi:Protein of unknown function (DUF2029).